MTDGGVSWGDNGDGAAELALAGDDAILARPLLLLLVPMTTVGGLLEAGRLMSSNDSFKPVVSVILLPEKEEELRCLPGA